MNPSHDNLPRYGDRRRMAVGLLGGSFNPAHAGHLHIARVALRRLKLDQVWLLVSPGIRSSRAPAWRACPNAWLRRVPSPMGDASSPPTSNGTCTRDTRSTRCAHSGGYSRAHASSG